MARVYLETSFFSACVSTRMTPRSLGWRATSLDWWRNERRRHELFISQEVVDEISAGDYEGRESALRMLSGLAMLDVTKSVQDFADILVREKLMPGPSLSGDALHVAAATLYRMDYVLTWNIQHLANRNKQMHFGVICLRLGVLPPAMITPDSLRETQR